MNEKILIIEDTLLNREMAKDLLELEGYRIIEAETGKEGFEKAIDEIPDLILMDMVLPDIDGMALAKKMKNNPRTRNKDIVAFSAQIEETNLKEILDVGFIGHIMKPIDTKTFAKKIREFLNIKKQSDDEKREF